MGLVLSRVSRFCSKLAVGGYVPIAVTNTVTPQDCAAKTVLVIGLPRGGTSVVAGSLHALGVYMGPPEQLRPGGAFESEVFMAGHREAWSKEIEWRNNQYSIWGWKDPHGMTILQHLPPGLRNLHCVFVFRDPIAIMTSRCVREQAPDPEATLASVCDELMNLHETSLATQWPALLVSYERIQSAPGVFLKSLTGFLQIDPGEERWVEALRRIRSEGGYLALPENWETTWERTDSKEGIRHE